MSRWFTLVRWPSAGSARLNGAGAACGGLSTLRVWAYLLAGWLCRASYARFRRLGVASMP